MGTDVTELFIVITVIAVALIFDYTNGFHDSANAMAGPIATGAIRPRIAVLLAAFLNFVGACLSTAVAKTISGGFFDDQLITASIILQLMTSVYPALKKIQEEGELGRRKITQYTRYLTVLLCMVQGVGIAY